MEETKQEKINRLKWELYVSILDDKTIDENESLFLALVDDGYIVEKIDSYPDPKTFFTKRNHNKGVDFSEMHIIKGANGKDKYRRNQRRTNPNNPHQANNKTSDALRSYCQ